LTSRRSADGRRGEKQKMAAGASTRFERRAISCISIAKRFLKLKAGRMTGQDCQIFFSLFLSRNIEQTLANGWIDPQFSDIVLRGKKQYDDNTTTRGWLKKFMGPLSRPCTWGPGKRSRSPSWRRWGTCIACRGRPRRPQAEREKKNVEMQILWGGDTKSALKNSSLLKRISTYLPNILSVPSCARTNPKTLWHGWDSNPRSLPEAESMNTKPHIQ
jgi:hypothetical protein